MGYQQTEGTGGTWHSRNRRWPRYSFENKRRVTDIPHRFRDLTVDDLPKTAAGTVVRGWCKRWGAYPTSGLSLTDFDHNRGRGLWLYGPPGVGKTTLACIAANHLSDLGWSTKFTTVANLHDLTLWPRKIADPAEQENARLLFECYDAAWDGWRCVVLDDLGKEHKTVSEWVQDVLDSLLRNRFNQAAPTIVTTNLSLDDVGDVYNASLGDFIHEAFMCVPVTGETYRWEPSNGR